MRWCRTCTSRSRSHAWGCASPTCRCRASRAGVASTSAPCGEVAYAHRASRRVHCGCSHAAQRSRLWQVEHPRQPTRRRRRRGQSAFANQRGRGVVVVALGRAITEASYMVIASVRLRWCRARHAEPSSRRPPQHSRSRRPRPSRRESGWIHIRLISVEPSTRCTPPQPTNCRRSPMTKAPWGRNAGASASARRPCPGRTREAVVELGEVAAIARGPVDADRRRRRYDRCGPQQPLGCRQRGANAGSLSIESGSTRLRANRRNGVQHGAIRAPAPRRTDQAGGGRRPRRARGDEVLLLEVSQQAAEIAGIEAEPWRRSRTRASGRRRSRTAGAKVRADGRCPGTSRPATRAAA